MESQAPPVSHPFLWIFAVVRRAPSLPGHCCEPGAVWAPARNRSEARIAVSVVTVGGPVQARSGTAGPFAVRALRRHPASPCPCLFPNSRLSALTRVAHLLFVKVLVVMPTLRRTANRQNSNDFLSRTVPNSETAVVLVLRQPLFWDSFGTVGLAIASTCAKILGNFSRGVAQPGSAPALGAGGRWFESSRPDHFLSSGVTPG